ncbi:Polycystic kidney disease protein 1-like 3 [Frankliniella fusca]|uniref:Polycystic kidney disease protein 1-like 3 n=1 Tax=Frankliniella fusca TaxID=407009 RepID=A0AAE1LNY3_9NEOP|nr:Polycystic kidney disease protein 1-like 3 [Frankliniella fusca]
MRRNFQVLALLAALLAVSAQDGRRGSVYGGGIPILIRARPDGVRADDLSPPPPPPASSEDPEAGGLSPGLGVVLLGGGYRPVLTASDGLPGHGGPRGVPLNLALLAALGGHVQAGGGYRGTGLADADIDDILSSIAQLGGARPESRPVRPGAEDEETADDKVPENEEGSGAEVSKDVDGKEPVTKPTRGKTVGKPGKQTEEAEDPDDADDAVTEPTRDKGPRNAARRGKQYGEEDGEVEDDEDDAEVPAGVKPPRGKGGHAGYAPEHDDGDAEGGEEESSGDRGVLHFLLRPPGVFGAGAGFYPGLPGLGRDQGEGVLVVRPGLGASRPTGPGAEEDAETGLGDVSSDGDGVFVVRPGLGVVGRPRPVRPSAGGARPEHDGGVVLVGRPGAERPARPGGAGGEGRPATRPGQAVPGRRPVSPGADEDSDGGEGVLVVRPGLGGLGPMLGRGRGQRVLIVPVSSLGSAPPPRSLLGPMRPGPGGSSWDFLLGGPAGPAGPASAPADLPGSVTPGVVMLGGWPFRVAGGPFAGSGSGPGESDGSGEELGDRWSHPKVAPKKKKPTKAKADKSPAPSDRPTENAGDSAPSHPHDKDKPEDKPHDEKPRGDSDVELEAHDVPEDRDDAPENTTTPAVTANEMAETEPTTPAGTTDATTDTGEATTLDTRT